jgi:hypothetical protein
MSRNCQRDRRQRIRSPVGQRCSCHALGSAYSPSPSSCSLSLGIRIARGIVVERAPAHDLLAIKRQSVDIHELAASVGCGLPSAIIQSDLNGLLIPGHLIRFHVLAPAVWLGEVDAGSVLALKKPTLQQPVPSHRWRFQAGFAAWLAIRHLVHGPRGWFARVERNMSEHSAQQENSTANAKSVELEATAPPTPASENMRQTAARRALGCCLRDRNYGN